MLEKIFKLSKRHTNVKIEILAGITTFLSMAYIVVVNPNILADSGMEFKALLCSTAIVTIISCLIMAFLGNYPIALAPSMATNALFSYSIVEGMGLSYKAALAALFISSTVFLIMTITGMRNRLVSAIPEVLKQAIMIAIGFFVTFVGLKMANIIVDHPTTLVTFGNLKDPKVLLSIIGIILLLILLVKQVKASMFLGILGTLIIGLIMSGFGIKGMPQFVYHFNLDFDFRYFGCFIEGFKELGHNLITSIIAIFSFLLVDFCDKTGCLLTLSKNADLVDENDNMIEGKPVMLADSIGNLVSVCFGLNTVTDTLESNGGIAVGGRSGLTALTTGILFILIFPFLGILPKLITPSIVAPVLVSVGVLMIQPLSQVHWDTLDDRIPAFILIITCLLSYSLSVGIGSGFLIFTIMKLINGKKTELNIWVYLFDLLFLIYFITM